MYMCKRGAVWKCIIRMHLRFAGSVLQEYTSNALLLPLGCQSFYQFFFLSDNDKDLKRAKGAICGTYLIYVSRIKTQIISKNVICVLVNECHILSVLHLLFTVNICVLSEWSTLPQVCFLIELYTSVALYVHVNMVLFKTPSGADTELVLLSLFVHS